MGRLRTSSSLRLQHTRSENSLVGIAGFDRHWQRVRWRRGCGRYLRSGCFDHLGRISEEPSDKRAGNRRSMWIWMSPQDNSVVGMIEGRRGREMSMEEARSL